MDQYTLVDKLTHEHIIISSNNKQKVLMKLKKLNTRGFSHELVLVAFVVIFAVAGVGYVVSSHAQSVKDPVGNGINRALAAEAVKYETRSTQGKYRYRYGALHGDTAQLRKFQNGGYTDCSAFVRYIIWKTYSVDVGSFTTGAMPSFKDIHGSPYFKRIPPSQVAAGDIGWQNLKEQHTDFITFNRGNGSIHQFGAHSSRTNIYGGNVRIGNYDAYYRYVGPRYPGYVGNPVIGGKNKPVPVTAGNPVIGGSNKPIAGGTRAP